MNDETYNPNPGNLHTAGQVRTPSPPVPQHGEAPTQIIMPSEKELAAERGREITVGSVTVRPSSGFYRGRAEVITAEGGTLKGDAGLFTLYEALKEVAEAAEAAPERSEAPAVAKGGKK